MRALHALFVVLVIFALMVLTYLVFMGGQKEDIVRRTVQVNGKTYGVMYPKSLRDSSPLVVYFPSDKRPKFFRYASADSQNSGYAIDGKNIMLTGLDFGVVTYVDTDQGLIEVKKDFWDRSVVGNEKRLAALVAECSFYNNIDAE